ncbi:protein of unknown function [Brevefilum fermentans]|uniref:Uncharacterized protein n=1 Tax=Candidatus Brevifilum fermentans TaxID=1986204 RepID=A0A1Y6K3M3_9CHLR|nr:protein of unknown function [Brevefilum fermentans]
MSLVTINSSWAMGLTRSRTLWISGFPDKNINALFSPILIDFPPAWITTLRAVAFKSLFSVIINPLFIIMGKVHLETFIYIGHRFALIEWLLDFN